MKFDKEIFDKVVKSYIQKINWENIKKGFNSIGYGFMLNFFLIFPLLVANDESRNLGLYYMFTVPVMIVLILAQMHGVGCDKLMFICPMTKSERIKHMNYAYLLKLAIGIFILLIPCLFCLITGRLSALDFGILLIANIILNISCGYDIKGLLKEYRPKYKGNLKYLDVYIGISVIMSLFFFVYIAIEIADGDMYGNLLGKYICIAIYLLIVIVPVYHLMKNYKNVMDFYSDYENIMMFNEK